MHEVVRPPVTASSLDMHAVLRFSFVLALASTAASSAASGQDSAVVKALWRRGGEALRDSAWTRAIVAFDSAAVIVTRDFAMTTPADSSLLYQIWYYASIARYVLLARLDERAMRHRDCDAARRALPLVAEVDSLLRLYPTEGPGDTFTPSTFFRRWEGHVRALIRRYCPDGRPDINFELQH